MSKKELREFIKKQIAYEEESHDSALHKYSEAVANGDAENKDLYSHISCIRMGKIQAYKYMLKNLEK